MQIFWSQLRNNILIPKQWDCFFFFFFFFFPFHFLLFFSLFFSSLFSFLIDNGSSGGGGGGGKRGGGWGVSLVCITPWPKTNLITDNSVLTHKTTTHALSLHQRMFHPPFKLFPRFFFSSESSTIFTSKTVKQVLKEFHQNKTIREEIPPVRAHVS